MAKALAAARKAAEPAAAPVAAGDHPHVTPGLADAASAMKVLGERYGDRIVMKSMWDLSYFGEAIQQLVSLQSSAAWEAQYEGDGSTVHAAMIQPIGALAQAFLDMAKEEVAELLSRMQDNGEDVVVMVMDADPDPVIIEAAARVVDAVKADAALVTKAGARNSKADQKRIQAAHDSMAEMGAECDDKNTGKGAEPAAGR